MRRAVSLCTAVSRGSRYAYPCSITHAPPATLSHAAAFADGPADKTTSHAIATSQPDGRTG